MAKSDFGKRLKEIFNNATNQQIAEKIGVSAPAVQHYVSGRVPDAEKLILITSVTNCNLHWLITGQGSKFLTDEFALEHEIEQDGDWMDVMRRWYEFDAQEFPDLEGAAFMGGWAAFSTRQKADALRDLRKLLDKNPTT